MYIFDNISHQQFGSSNNYPAIEQSMWMLPFIFVIVCIVVLLSGSKSVQISYRLFIYVLPFEIQ